MGDNEFGIFLNKLDNEARVNLDICNDVKITIQTRIESERKKGMKKRFKKSYLKYKASKYNNLQHSLINDNYYYRKIIKPRKIIIVKLFLLSKPSKGLSCKMLSMRS